MGGLVEPLVGGLMRSGGAYGDVMNVGAGNMDNKKREEKEEAHRPVGGGTDRGESFRVDGLRGGNL